MTVIPECSTSKEPWDNIIKKIRVGMKKSVYLTKANLRAC